MRQAQLSQSCTYRKDPTQCISINKMEFFSISLFNFILTVLLAQIGCICGMLYFFCNFSIVLLLEHLTNYFYTSPGTSEKIQCIMWKVWNKILLRKKPHKSTKSEIWIDFYQKNIMMVEKAEGFLFRKPVYQYFQYLET